MHMTCSFVKVSSCAYRLTYRLKQGKSVLLCVTGRLAARTAFCYLDIEALAAFNPAIRRCRTLLPTVDLYHRFASPHE